MLKTYSSSPLSPLQWATQEPKRQWACPTYAPGLDSNSGEEKGVKSKGQTADIRGQQGHAAGSGPSGKSLTLESDQSQATCLLMSRILSP